MDKLDRSLQLEILTYLKGIYPEINTDVYLSIFKDKGDLKGNLKYLYEHGLINANISKTLNSPFAIMVTGITNKGLDLLEDDGGLSAIFNTVTVRFDADNIRSILEQKVLSLPVSDRERSSLLDQIRRLPEQALKELMTKLIGVGLDHAPTLAQWIMSLKSDPTIPPGPTNVV
jgi:hypothetical protein